jgi:hypothetical protein
VVNMSCMDHRLYCLIGYRSTLMRLLYIASTIDVFRGGIPKMTLPFAWQRHDLQPAEYL